MARPAEGLLLAVVFAVENSGYLWLVLRRPGPLGAWRHSGVFGLVATMAVAVLVLLARQRSPFGDFVVPGTLMLAAILAPLSAGGLAAVVHLVRRGGIGQSMRTGAVECSVGGAADPVGRVQRGSADHPG